MKDICRFILESTSRRRIVPILPVTSVRAARAAPKWHEILRLTSPEGCRGETAIVSRIESLSFWK